MSADEQVLLECQFCQGPITHRDPTKICNTCRTVIHADCWEAFEKACPTSHCGAREGWSDGRGTKKVTALPSEIEEKGKKCKRCRGAIREADATKLCNHCGEVLHTFCWQAAQRLCPTASCGAKAGWSDGKGAAKIGVKLPEQKGVQPTISSSLGRFFRQLLAGSGETNPK